MALDSNLPRFSQALRRETNQYQIAPPMSVPPKVMASHGADELGPVLVDGDAFAESRALGGVEATSGEDLTGPARVYSFGSPTKRKVRFPALIWAYQRR